MLKPHSVEVDILTNPKLIHRHHLGFNVVHAVSSVRLGLANMDSQVHGASVLKVHELAYQSLIKHVSARQHEQATWADEVARQHHAHFEVADVHGDLAKAGFFNNFL